MTDNPCENEIEIDVTRPEFERVMFVHPSWTEDNPPPAGYTPRAGLRDQDLPPFKASGAKPPAQSPPLPRSAAP